MTIKLPAPYEDLEVERAIDGSLSIFDSDGDVMHDGIPPHWKANDIFVALNIGRACFEQGKRFGRIEKVQEIRKALSEDMP